jgi:DNA repair exonuclease SbcCD ATPase subunit
VVVNDRKIITKQKEKIMTTSKQIETELNQVTQRLDGLTVMQTGINTNLQNLQQGFVGGKTSLDELQTEQGKLTILSASIKALEAKQDELHTAFQMASASESRQETLDRMKVITDEANAAFNEYLKLRAKLVEACRTVGEKMVDALILSQYKQWEFSAVLSRLAPDRESVKQTRDELKEIGLSETDFSNMSSDFMVAPETDFPEAVHFVEQTVANTAYRRTSQAAKA